MEKLEKTKNKYGKLDSRKINLMIKNKDIIEVPDEYSMELKYVGNYLATIPLNKKTKDIISSIQKYKRTYKYAFEVFKPLKILHYNKSIKQFSFIDEPETYPRLVFTNYELIDMYDDCFIDLQPFFYNTNILKACLEQMAGNGVSIYDYNILEENIEKYNEVKDYLDISQRAKNQLEMRYIMFGSVCNPYLNNNIQIEYKKYLNLDFDTNLFSFFAHIDRLKNRRIKNSSYKSYIEKKLQQYTYIKNKIEYDIYDLIMLGNILKEKVIELDLKIKPKYENVSLSIRSQMQNPFDKIYNNLSKQEQSLFRATTTRTRAFDGKFKNEMLALKKHYTLRYLVDTILKDFDFKYFENIKKQDYMAYKYNLLTELSQNEELYYELVELHQLLIIPYKHYEPISQYSAKYKKIFNLFIGKRYSKTQTQSIMKHYRDILKILSNRQSDVLFDLVDIYLDNYVYADNTIGGLEWDSFGDFRENLAEEISEIENTNL